MKLIYPAPTSICWSCSRPCSKSATWAGRRRGSTCRPRPSAMGSAGCASFSTTRCSCARRRAWSRPRAALELAAPDRRHPRPGPERRVDRADRSTRHVPRAASRSARRTESRRSSCPPLLEKLQQAAPGIDISVRQIASLARARLALRHGRTGSARNGCRHPSHRRNPGALCRTASLRGGLRHRDARGASVCGKPDAWTDTARCEHLVVSHGGDPHGFVDQVLAKRGRAAARRADRSELHVCACGCRRDRPDLRLAAGHSSHSTAPASAS